MYAYVTLPFNRRRLATTSRRLCYSNRDNESSAAMDGTPRHQAHPPNRHASKPSASGYFLPHQQLSPIPTRERQSRQKRLRAQTGTKFRRQASRQGHERRRIFHFGEENESKGRKGHNNPPKMSKGKCNVRAQIS